MMSKRPDRVGSILEIYLCIDEVKTSSEDTVSHRVSQKGAPMYSVHFQWSEPINHSRLEQGFLSLQVVWRRFWSKMHGSLYQRLVPWSHAGYRR